MRTRVKSSALSTTNAVQVCLARCILSDPNVLLLQKPFALLPADQADRVRATLRDFVEYGGVRVALLLSVIPL